MGQRKWQGIRLHDWEVAFIGLLVAGEGLREAMREMDVSSYQLSALAYKISVENDRRKELRRQRKAVDEEKRRIREKERRERDGKGKVLPDL